METYRNPGVEGHGGERSGERVVGIFSVSGGLEERAGFGAKQVFLYVFFTKSMGFYVFSLETPGVSVSFRSENQWLSVCLRLVVYRRKFCRFV